MHGSERCFRKFINSAKFYGANVLVLGGDITGKMIVPITKVDDRFFVCTYPDGELKIKAKELEDTVKGIKDSGYYPYRCSKDELEALVSDKTKVDNLFRKLMIESVDNWVKLAHERLNGTLVKCYISPGNDDILEIDDHLVDTGIVINPENKVVKIDDSHEMVTLGYVNHTPWNSAREVDEEKLEDMLEKLCKQVQDMKNCIFNIHVPPINTVLDKAPALTPDLKPIVQGGHVQTMSAGSIACRKIIEKYQPLAGIHGHIHESKGVESIGRTVCFNPGSDYSEGALKGLLLVIEKDKIKSHMFIAG